MIRRRAFGLLLGAGVSATALLIAPLTADATGATSNISGGSLAFINSTPGNVSFSATLNGANQVATTPQTFDVGDSTGSGSGWNITATSTSFTTGGAIPHVLANDSVSVQAIGVPSASCDNNVSCTTATNGISYPYSLPADTSAPTASKVFNAAVDTGLGNQSLTPTWSLSLPANTYAGTYQSTWTFSLVSGP
jgi:hypothetical protein